MKRYALSILMAGTMLMSGGCFIANTPGYTGEERFRQIGRNMNYEWEQMNDDIDHVLLLRPASRMTTWDLEHRN